MPVFKRYKAFHFKPEAPVEKHFHDYDETWIVTAGKCKAFMIGRDGRRTAFDLEAGDIWMVEAGVEHGCDPNEGGVDIFPFAGTIPEGAIARGHIYMEKENYMPTLVLEKRPLDRYKKK